MSTNPFSDLEFLKLVKEEKKLPKDLTGLKVLKVAVLSQYASQHLSSIMRVLAYRNGIDLQIYNADFDSIELEIHNSGSNLYSFDPDFILLQYSTEKLKGEFYQFSHLTENWASDIVNRIVGSWNLLNKHSKATIVHSTIVLPYERIFGNFDRKMSSTLLSQIEFINASLIEAARTNNQVLVNDVDLLAGYVGRKNWIDERMWALAKEPCSPHFIPIVAKSFVDIFASAMGKLIKCIVLDLDNTLWGGVIGDDGLEGISLGNVGDGESFVNFQRFILSLKRRGIILAVCSKNDYSNAILPFQSHPDMVLKESDISVFVANWKNKAENIRQIKSVLNIGFDSILFLDDNPFERNLVRELLPEVVVPELPEDPSIYVRAICEYNFFESTTFSEADIHRPEQYRVEAKRALVKDEFQNINDYIKSLEMNISLDKFNSFNLPRIAQLIQRSNQYNLCTNRYSISDCERIMNDEARFIPFSVSLNDRFGDYGLVAVAVLKICDDRLEINEFLMSCRVLQRGVENCVLNKVFEIAREIGTNSVVGIYKPSSKNQMVKDFYKDFGFLLVKEEVSNTIWRQDVETFTKKPHFLHIENNF